MIYSKMVCPLKRVCHPLVPVLVRVCWLVSFPWSAFLPRSLDEYYILLQYYVCVDKVQYVGSPSPAHFDEYISYCNTAYMGIPHARVPG